MRMGLPRHVPPAEPSSGHGPFGDKAFKGALILCAVLVAAGLPMLLLGGGVATPLGTSFLALGLLGLVTGGAGLLAERVAKRRPPPPADVRRANGRGPARRV
jgi:hypothetical protein